MRANRFFWTAMLGMIVGLGSAVMLTAQAKSDEDFDKLMKAVNAANGVVRKGTDMDAQAVEAGKLVVLFKDAQQFWTGRNNKEAADWSAAAMKHAGAVEAAFKSKNTEAIAAAVKELGSTCQTCHMKYRERTEAGYQIKKG